MDHEEPTERPRRPAPPAERWLRLISILAALSLGASPVCLLLSLGDMAVHGTSALFWVSGILLVFATLASGLVAGATRALGPRASLGTTWWSTLSRVVLALCALVVLGAVVSEL